MEARTVEQLVAESARLAERFVAPLGRRWQHVQSVARVAETFRAAIGDVDMPHLLSAAWLHDIGYSAELATSDFHPLDGANYLRLVGFPDRIVNLVAHHSGARFEAAERGLGAELRDFPLEDSPVMDALITADLTTGPDGERLTYRRRIAEILERYPDGPVHRAWVNAADVMVVSVRRSVERLRGVGDYPIYGVDRRLR